MLIMLVMLGVLLKYLRTVSSVLCRRLLLTLSAERELTKLGSRICFEFDRFLIFLFGSGMLKLNVKWFSVITNCYSCSKVEPNVLKLSADSIFLTEISLSTACENAAHSCKSSVYCCVLLSLI